MPASRPGLPPAFDPGDRVLVCAHSVRHFDYRGRLATVLRGPSEIPDLFCGSYDVRVDGCTGTNAYWAQALFRVGDPERMPCQGCDRRVIVSRSSITDRDGSEHACTEVWPERFVHYVPGPGTHPVTACSRALGARPGIPDACITHSTIPSEVTCSACRPVAEAVASYGEKDG